MNTYLIRGYFDASPSYQFDLDANDYPTAQACVNVMRSHSDETSGAYRLLTEDVCAMNTCEERQDLADNDKQRVYLLYLDAHGHWDDEEYENAPEECKEDTCDCESTDLLITVDIDNNGE